MHAQQLPPSFLVVQVEGAITAHLIRLLEGVVLVSLHIFLELVHAHPILFHVVVVEVRPMWGL